MTIKPTMDTTIMSTLVTGMLKLHRISGDSKGPIIAQAHNNNDNGCSGLDPDLSPPPPVLWLCLATGPRPVTDFSSGSSQHAVPQWCNNKEKCVGCSHSRQ